MSRKLCSLVACLIAPTTILGPHRSAGQEKQPAPPPGILVDVGGHKLNLRCLGSGSPTVVLEAGMGDDSTRWSLVQDAASQRLRTCSYDRAGSGQSERGPLPRTMKQEVFELHLLLKAAHVPAPYLLVGHSYGGLLVRLYTEEYSKDVIGLVLVDATHESTRLYLQKRGEPTGKWVRIREGAQDRPVPPVQETMSAPSSRSSEMYWAEELQQMYESRKKNPEPLGDRPLIVLAAGKSSDRPPDTPPDLWDELQLEKAEQKADLARLSRNAKLVRDPSSGHHIHVDNPQLVVASIKEVIEAARENRRLSQ